MRTGVVRSENAFYDADCLIRPCETLESTSDLEEEEKSSQDSNFYGEFNEEEEDVSEMNFRLVVLNEVLEFLQPDPDG